MRVAAVDIGTNSTRLLVADVGPGGVVDELDRRTTITRLGEGVDSTGVLADAAMERVFEALAGYREALDALGAEATTAVMTSAVRDARNGAAFAAQVRERFSLDARAISGEEEARLTFLGATSERPDDGTGLVVIDIGGGSTELVTGADGVVSSFVSTQAGVVRQTERHIRSDPPTPAELDALAADARDTFQASVLPEVRERVRAGIAVAGTATSCAAMSQCLEPYDPARVHGFVLTDGEVRRLLALLASMTDAQRREVAGLHPDRAPAIVAGIVLLIEAMRTFDLREVVVSEHDILRGAALARAGVT